MRALIAGGSKAITHPVEGAEDSRANARRELKKIGLAKTDTLVGLSGQWLHSLRSGRHCLCKRRGALTIAVTANRKSPLAEAAHIAITPDVGPEVLTGSTRLKAGTAQKMVLNMLSTATMVRLGHAYENLMIDLTKTNRKLRGRAKRILDGGDGQKCVGRGTRFASKQTQFARRADHPETPHFR